MYIDTRERNLRNRVREQRKALGLSQAELARRAGVSRQTVNKVERQPGYAVPKMVCVRLAGALAVEESWLFYEDPKPYSVGDDADTEEG
jgi:putative transcriptional regulator